MAGVTQTIDNYYAGISNQPDLKKFPGQVKDIINAITDPIEGLYKRPGSKRIGTTPLVNVHHDGSWFHENVKLLIFLPYLKRNTLPSFCGLVGSFTT